MAGSTLSERLVWARTRQQMTQDAVATAVGMSQSSYGDLESGRSKTTRHVASLSSVLDVSPIWLERGTGTPGTAAIRETVPAYADTVNEADLTVVIDAVETWLLESGRALSPSDKASLIGSLYKMLPEALAEADRLATKPKVVSLLETIDRLHGSATRTPGPVVAGTANSQPAKRENRRRVGR